MESRPGPGVWIRWTGMVEWNGGMDWTGLEWNGMEWNDQRNVGLALSPDPFS